MAGIGAASGNRRLLVAGIVAALALLVLVGRVQRFARPVTEPPAGTVLPVRVAARPLEGAARLHIGPPVVPIGGEAFPVAVGEGAVWVVLHGELVRVDPSRNRVTARVRVSLPERVSDVLLAGGGTVWVATSAGVVGVDPRTGRVLGTVPTNGRGVPVAVEGGSLWWLACDGTAAAGRCRLRSDPPTLAVTTVLSVPEPVVPGVAVEGGSAWVLSGTGPGLWRLPIAGGAPARLVLPLLTPPAPAQAVAHGTAVANGFGAVWVLTDLYAAAAPSGSRIGPALLRIDPATGRVAAALPLADLDRPVALAIGARFVWVQGWQIRRDATASVVVEGVDPATLRVVEAFDTGGDADSRIAVGFGSLWVTRPSTGNLLHVDAER